MKPHRGAICGKRVHIPVELLDGHSFPKHLGYIIAGRFINHPNFHGGPGQTSLIVKKGRWKKDGTCEVETLNSCYTWVKPVGGL